MLQNTSVPLHAFNNTKNMARQSFKKKKPAASRKRGLARVDQGLVPQVRVLNLHRSYGIDPWAKRVLDVAVNPERHPELNQKISNYLLGFDAEMQSIMAEAIALYVGGHAISVTCLPAVDAVLRKFYREIDSLQSSIR